MSFRCMTEEKDDDEKGDSEKEGDDEKKTVLSSTAMSTSVFKFGPKLHPIGKPMTRSQRKANEEYELSEQISMLRKVAERDIDVRDCIDDNVESEVVDPDIRQPSEMDDRMYDEPCDPVVPRVNLDPQIADSDRPDKRKRETTTIPVEKKKRVRYPHVNKFWSFLTTQKSL